MSREVSGMSQTLPPGVSLDVEGSRMRFLEVSGAIRLCRIGDQHPVGARLPCVQVSRRGRRECIGTRRALRDDEHLCRLARIAEIHEYPFARRRVVSLKLDDGTG